MCEREKQQHLIEGHLEKGVEGAPELEETEIEPFYLVY